MKDTGLRPRARPGRPPVIRTLATSTKLYHQMVEDALAVIERVMAEDPDLVDDYLEVAEHLRILLDEREMGSLLQVLRCCRTLLGEE